MAPFPLLGPNSYPSLEARLALRLSALCLLIISATASLCVKSIDSATSMYVFWSLLALLGIVSCISIWAIVSFSLWRIKSLSRAFTEARKINERLGFKEIHGLPREIIPFVKAAAENFDRLNKVVKRQQKYLSNISHEFRTHLAILQGRTDMFLEGDTRKTLSKDIAGLARVIDQSLIIAQLRTGQFGFEQIDLVKIVRNIAAFYVPQTLEQDRQIEFDAATSAVLIRGNPGVIEATIRNVIENAIQHTRTRSTVEISVDATGSIHVRDHGPGIPENKRHEMFEPFWPERDQRKGGAGLGLALVREAIFLHGGTVRFENHPEGGAIFTISLPLMDNSPTKKEFPELPLSHFSSTESAHISFLTRFFHRPKHGQLDAAYLAAIIENSHDAIISKRVDGVITSWNKAAETIFGYTDSEMIGQLAQKLFPTNRRNDEDYILERLHDGERIEHFETVHVRKDGKEIFVSLSISPILDNTGFIIGISRIARDITEKKRIEKSLREKLSLLSAITDNSAEGMLLADRNGHITFVNPAAERLTGWGADELLGKQLHGTLHHSRRDGSAHPIKECPLVTVYRTGKSVDLEDIMFKKDGTYFDVAYSNAPTIVDGEITGGVLIVHDISERKRAEAAMHEASKLEAMASLTGGLAHDFNNLLCIIIVNLDTLMTEDNVSPEITELASDALNAALRGGELTHSLLAFARRQTLQSRLMHANSLVTETIKLLSRTLGEDIEIICSLTEDAWPIVADPSQLEATLTNLALNSRDAMPKGGTLTITTSNCHLEQANMGLGNEVAEGDYLMIEITDTGSGIPKDIRDKVFEPFFTTKDYGKGTGLGLSAVFGFIKQSGGAIQFDSQKDEGTTFRLYFPRAINAIEVAKTQPESFAGGNGETILVVEDNPSLRRIVVKQLSNLGYNPLEAGSVVEALTILEIQTVPIIFTDVVMPGGLSGFDLVDKVRTKWPQIKLIITSGFPDIKLAEAALDMSHLTILSKPYRREELGKLLARLCDKNN